MGTRRTMADYNEDYKNAAYVLHNFYNDLYEWVQRPAWLRLWNPNKFRSDIGLCGNLTWYLSKNPSMKQYRGDAEYYQGKLFQQQYNTYYSPFGRYTGEDLYIEHHVRMKHLDRYRSYPVLYRALKKIV